MGAKAVFIDLLSIAPYKSGDYWLGYRQFCEQFLNPLLLNSHMGISHYNWYRGNLEGISTKEINKLLSFKQKLSWRTFFHICLQSKLEDNSLKSPTKFLDRKKSIKPLPESGYTGLITQMYNWIKDLEPKKNQNSVWKDYAKKNTYLENETKYKHDIVYNFAKKNNPKKLIDLGCNIGDYSITALKGGARLVIGYDFDNQAINMAFKKAKKHGHNFLPLYLDATNPSPNQGWLQNERKGFKERNSSDAVIALAFIHHLVIGKNIPFNQAILFITSIGKRGLIEFVPKNDETVQSMLTWREDIFLDYNEKNFENLLSEKVKINNTYNISSSGRKIYEFIQKD